MCERYTLAKPIEAVRVMCRLQSEVNLAPRYNIAPGQPIAVVWQDAAGDRSLDLMTWGLPSGGPGRQPRIHTRAETIDTQPVARDAFATYRCLIPADGFYEWRADRKPSQPWRFTRTDDALFAFAGLWNPGSAPSTPGVRTALIVTVPANDLISPVHDRMPVMLDAERAESWLLPEADNDTLKSLLVPYPSAAMKGHPVSARVNDAAIDDPMCIEQWDDAQLF